MSKNDNESHEPSVKPLPQDSILPTIEAIQSRLLTIFSIADLLSSLSPSTTLNTSTLPALGSFLLEECTEVLSSLESIHKSVTFLLAGQKE